MQAAAATVANTAIAIGQAMAELNVDPAVIQSTQKLLNDAADTLSATATTFPIMGTIQRTSFGTDDAALNLSQEHRYAHEVMEKTIKGVNKDVEVFCANLLQAVKLLGSADSDAAADVRQRQEWLERTQYGAQNLHGEQAHEQAQEEVQQEAQSETGDA